MVLCLFTACSVFTPSPQSLRPVSGLAVKDDVPSSVPWGFVPVLPGPKDPVEGPPPYQVRFGDIYEIEVEGVEASAATTVVMPDGNLYYHSIPGFPAAGKTISALEADLTERLREVYADPVVLLRPIRVVSGRVTLVGQVVSPGAYDLIRPGTVRDALVLAGGWKCSSPLDTGGLRPLADFRRCLLIRKDRLVPVDFVRLLGDGDLRWNIPVHPGDVLVLPPRSAPEIEVQGAVNRPGAVTYSEGLTLVQAIAAAGGIAPECYREGVLLFRRPASSDPLVAEVDLGLVLHGDENGAALMPDDLIWIPASPWKDLGRTARAALDSSWVSIAQDRALEGTNGSGGEPQVAQGPGALEKP